MIEAIFEGARSRCKRHADQLLAPNQIECPTCKIIRRNLSFQPPFDVRCDRGGFGCKQGTIYTVVWVIREGAKEYSENAYGYTFYEENTKKILDRIYDPIDFTPVACLSDEEREKLGIKVEPFKPSFFRNSEEDWYG